MSGFVRRTDLYRQPRSVGALPAGLERRRVPIGPGGGAGCLDACCDRTSRLITAALCQHIRSDPGWRTFKRRPRSAVRLTGRSRRRAFRYTPLHAGHQSAQPLQRPPVPFSAADCTANRCFSAGRNDIFAALNVSVRELISSRYHDSSEPPPTALRGSAREGESRRASPWRIAPWRRRSRGG
jgi:hypothetical protein